MEETPLYPSPDLPEGTPALPVIANVTDDEPGISAEQPPAESAHILSPDKIAREMPEKTRGPVPSKVAASARADNSLDKQLAKDEKEQTPGAGYLSIKEAARLLGVSPRSVYTYIEQGKLQGARVNNLTVVVSHDAQNYERRAPGRLRTHTPPWRTSSAQNYQSLTILTARIRPGQSALLERKLYELRATQQHRLLGTSARYIVRNEHDPDEVEIVLVWRSAVMPALALRETALGAFCAEFIGILDWSTLSRRDGRVYLHA